MSLQNQPSYILWTTIGFVHSVGKMSVLEAGKICGVVGGFLVGSISNNVCDNDFGIELFFAISAHLAY